MTTASAIDRLLERRSPEGGFAGLPGGPLRIDATAWVALALDASGAADPAVVERARDLLAAVQQPDGRLIALPRHLGSIWPTPVGVLAWQGSERHRAAQDRAVSFLLETSGQTLDEPLPILGDDPTLEGWPWIERTYAWVEPTATAMLALTAAGRGAHPRVEEGARLLLDRQLPSGGWNFGNKELFDTELRPAPESTGPALAALAGRVARERVAVSLEQLAHEVVAIRSPLALGWGLLGLSAWGERPTAAADWVAETLERESPVLPYDTAELALLLVALWVEEGLARHFGSEPGSTP